MDTLLRAIETTTTIDDSEIDETEWLRAANANPSYAFLKDAAQDIYTLDDGEPLDVER